MLKTPLISRRAAVAALSVPAVSALAGGARAAPPADISAFRDICFLTPQQIEGPYYLDPGARPHSRSPRAGRACRYGSICASIDGATCKPTARARVDIWHADAQGIYSGYEGQGDKQNLSTVGQKFLRGTQFTDSKGAVSFRDDLSRLVHRPRHAYSLQGACR